MSLSAGNKQVIHSDTVKSNLLKTTVFVVISFLKDIAKMGKYKRRENAGKKILCLF